MNNRFSKLSKSIVIAVTLSSLGAGLASAQTIVAPRSGEGVIQLRPIDRFQITPPSGGNRLEIVRPGGDRAWPVAVAAVAVAVEVATKIAHHVTESFLPGPGLVSRPGFAQLGVYDR